MTIDAAAFNIPCTGDVCTGDVILFSEGVFGGSYRNARFLGQRRIAARVINDSYGATKQQHTFTVEILASDGYEPLTVGTMTTRKGRNVYRNGTLRQSWPDESVRNGSLAAKHERGAAARAARGRRREREMAEPPDVRWRR